MAVTVAHSTTVTGADEAGKEINKAQWNGTGAHTVVVEDNTLVAAKLSATATDVLFGRSTAGAGAGEEVACTAAGRALLDDAAASNQRTTLGLGSIATQDSSSVSITGGTITGTTGVVYTLTAFHTSTNPVDGQTIYFGGAAIAPQTTAAIYRVPIPVSGTVIRLDINVGVSGATATTETGSAYFRLNNTTDTEISTGVLWSAASQSYSAAVSTAVAAGDYFQIKVVQPTWATNPTGVVITAIVTIRT